MEHYVLHRCVLLVLLTLSVTFSLSGDKGFHEGEDSYFLSEDGTLFVVSIDEDFNEEGISGSGESSGSGDDHEAGEQYSGSGQEEESSTLFQEDLMFKTTTPFPTLDITTVAILDTTAIYESTTVIVEPEATTIVTTIPPQSLNSQETTAAPLINVDIESEYCKNFKFGCCLNSTLPAHSLSGQGCCLNAPQGCCPDFETDFISGEECHCSFTIQGCCQDGISYASLGCGCNESQFGCCPDQYTSALGPNYEGCGCHTFQYGCCQDGVTPDDGINSCQNTKGNCILSEFGCCSDGRTEAKGGDLKGCTCASSEFGCCPDGETEARGIDFEGCESKPGDICHMEKDSGSCRSYNITRKWYFDAQYGGCSRFWFGGCGGNGNRFDARSACESVCVNPSGTVKCYLPRVLGPVSCTSREPQFYYDSKSQECREFTYNGCLGNANRFSSHQVCEAECMKAVQRPQNEDPCNQSVEPGPCKGYFPLWYFDDSRGECNNFIYGGCKGNKNQFMSKEACENSCKHKLLFQKIKKQCRKPRLVQTDGRHCHIASSVSSKWYFDEELHSCVPFYLSMRSDLKCGSILIEDHSNKTIYDSLGECASICPNTYAPILAIHSHNVTVKEEHEAVLMVEISSNPHSTIVWSFNGSQIYSSSQEGGDPRITIEPRGTLRINPALTTDSGKWIVTASNGIGGDLSEEIELAVNPTEAPLQVRIHQTGENPYQIGSKITMACEVNGFPIPTVNWYKNNARLPNSGRVRWSKETKELVIENANLIDNGYYTCRAWNFLESSHDSRNIKVEKFDNKTECTDNPRLARCELIVKGRFCLRDPLYFQICCHSCTAAGLIYNP